MFVGFIFKWVIFCVCINFNVIVRWEVNLILCFFLIIFFLLFRIFCNVFGLVNFIIIIFLGRGCFKLEVVRVYIIWGWENEVIEVFVWKFCSIVFGFFEFVFIFFIVILCLWNLFLYIVLKFLFLRGFKICIRVVLLLERILIFWIKVLYWRVIVFVGFLDWLWINDNIWLKGKFVWV